MTGRKQGETPADEGGSGTKPPRFKNLQILPNEAMPRIIQLLLCLGFLLVSLCLILVNFCYRVFLYSRTFEGVPFENMVERERGDTKDHPNSQWFLTFSEADELLKLAAARQQVQAHIVKLRRQFSVTDGPPQNKCINTHEVLQKKLPGTLLFELGI